MAATAKLLHAAFIVSTDPQMRGDDDEEDRSVRLQRVVGSSRCGRLVGASMHCGRPHGLKPNWRISRPPSPSTPAAGVRLPGLRWRDRCQR